MEPFKIVKCGVHTKKKYLKALEVLDRKILQAIIGAHIKVQWEMLYLETAVFPISSLIIARRLMYLQTIFKRTENESVHCSKECPYKR